MPLTLGLSILVSGAFGTVQVTTPPPPVHHTTPIAMSARAEFASEVMDSPADPDVQSAVQKYFSDIPIMIAIAGCESRFHQYDLTGNVLLSVTDDIGVMQINSYTHKDTAAQMGLNLNTVDGNMAYARWLYNQSGTSPWLSSKRCWGPQNIVANAPTSGNQSLALGAK